MRQGQSYKHWAEASVETKGEQKSFSYVEVSLLAHVLKGAQLLTDKPWALICGKQNSEMLLMYLKYQKSNS